MGFGIIKWNRSMEEKQNSITWIQTAFKSI